MLHDSLSGNVHSLEILLVNIQNYQIEKLQCNDTFPLFFSGGGGMGVPLCPHDEQDIWSRMHDRNIRAEYFGKCCFINATTLQASFQNLRY
jgi:hypothetical protein